MSIRCLGCMKMKENRPVCEHCGYNENVPNYPHQLPIGTVLQNRYTVGKVLGQGGFGITYIGWDNSLDTPVAVKEYYPASLVNRDCHYTREVFCNGEGAEGLFAHNRERFLKEAKILAKLQNVPGIVRVQNLFGENNTAYIVMEYVEGIDLKHYIRLQNRVLTVQEAFAVLRPVMYALSKVHEAELVHRDISPDNIMIQKDGSAKLLDFGAAREVADAEVNKELPQSTEAILKHGFAPMEQYQRRGTLGPWTDVYALCATLYYCLTGKVPADAPERIMGSDNVNWRQIPGLTEQQIQTLEKGLALLPENRIRTMRELHAGLFGQTATGFTQVQKEEPKPEPEKKPEPKKKPEKKAEKKPDYPTHTVSLESDDSDANRRGGSSTLPKVTKTEQKKKKPFGLIAAVLAIVAAVGVFALKPKEDGDVVPTDKPVLSETEPAIVVTLSPEELQYQEAEALAAEGKHAHAGITFAKLGDYADARERSFEQWSYTRKMKTVAHGSYYPYYRYIIAVKNGGTVVATGSTTKGECDVSHWTDIVEVVAFRGCSIGLKADGTVVFNKGYEHHFPELKAAESWTDIISISPLDIYSGGLVGLKSDGTVVTAENDLDLSDWTDIVSAFNINYGIIGLKADGTISYKLVSDAPANVDFDPAVWTDIIAIQGSANAFLAVKADGSVLTASYSWDDYQYTTDHLTQYNDVIGVAYGNEVYSDGAWRRISLFLKADGTVGVYPEDIDWTVKDIVTNWTGVKELYDTYLGIWALKEDGTVFSLTGHADDWTDVAEIIPYNKGIIGLRSDGTALALDNASTNIQNTIESWTDIRLPAPRVQPKTTVLQEGLTAPDPTE